MQNNYIYLLGKFWDFSEDKQLGSSAILIYLYLLKEAFNRNNARFSISDVQISKNLNLTNALDQQAFTEIQMIRLELQSELERLKNAK